jgi:co-chaperonin GroES (HSP10)
MVAPTDMDWNPEIHADRYGIVESIPEMLSTGKMMWNTDIELQVGDLVWYDYLMSLNSDSFFIEDVEYKLMDYQYLYVVKRGDDIICLNGYCLFEPKKDTLTTKSDLIIIHEGNDIRLAKLVIKSVPNKSYENEWVDDNSIDIGDMAIFGMPPIMLEAEYYSLFEGKRQYRISQRRFVYGYIRDGELYPMADCIVVIPDSRKAFTDNGIVIPESFRKRTNYGVVYKSCENNPSKGDRVHYHNTSATYIEHNGVEYGLLRLSNILYYES